MPIALFKKKAFFTKEEAEQIVAAIRESEKLTSGEIRVYVETKCKYMDPMIRAQEIFVKLNMYKTLLHNGVLIYVASQDKQLALYADKGIHAKVNADVWKNALTLMQENFAQQQYVQGLISCANYIGVLLQQYFPYDSQDKNELPDNIVFGK
jgi:uncharacterized membrane protein